MLRRMQCPPSAFRRACLPTLRFYSGRPDRTLVDLPNDAASGVEVYRTVMSDATQLKLYDELAYVLEKQGQKTFVTGNAEAKVIRNVCVDLHGYEHVQTMKNWERMSDQHVFGLVWSPTLVEFVKSTATEILGFEPDTARIVEHQAPGYEMHVEHPSYGTSFAVLNLMSPTVWSFDNEAENRDGSMYLPERSFAKISGESRWGWRIGQNFDASSLYFRPLRKQIEPDGLNISIWLCKFDPKLVDKRGLSDKIEQSVERLAKTSREAANEAKDSENAGLSGGFGGAEKTLGKVKAAPMAASIPGEDESDALERAAKIAKDREEEEAFAREALEGTGMLGGELTQEKKQTPVAGRKTPQTVEDGQKQLHGYRQDLGKLGAVMSKVSTRAESGESMSDDWLKGEINSALGDSKRADRDFDPETDLGDWGDIEDKAKHYKQKLTEMNFDAAPTKDAMKKNLSKAKAASEAFAGEVEVEVFDPVAAAKSVRDMHADIQGHKRR